MVVNDNVHCLDERGVWAFFASKAGSHQGLRYIQRRSVGWRAAIAGKPAPTGIEYIY